MGWFVLSVALLVAALVGALLTFAFAKIAQDPDPDVERTVGIKLQGMYLIYAVLVGSCIFIAGRYYSVAVEAISDESVAAAAIIRDARALPAEQGKPIVDAVNYYLVASISVDWPELGSGQTPLGAQSAMQTVTDSIAKVNGGPTAVNLQDEMLFHVNEMDVARKDRVYFAANAAPKFIWAVMGIGGLIVIVMSATQQFGSVRRHAMLVAALSALVGLGLFTVFALERPFTGPFPVSPTSLLELQKVASSPEYEPGR